MFKEAKRHNQKAYLIIRNSPKLLITAVIVLASVMIDISSAAEQGKSTAARQASKRSIIRSSKQLPTTQTIDSSAKTYKPLKRVKVDEPAGGQLRRTTVKFMEVEILVNDQFSTEYISTLPRAPGSNLGVLDRTESN